MDQRPKIHVFLGAPPPASVCGSEPGAGLEERPSAGWRHLELTWREGRLTPAAGIPGNGARTSRMDSVGDGPEPSSQGLESSGNPTEPESDRTTEAARGRPDRTGPAALGTQRDSDGAEEDPCSASVLEYLDSCFPAAQPDPEPDPEPEPGPEPDPEPDPEPEPGPEPGPEPIPGPSTSTQYLSTWTLSQALIMRGRRSVQSASSPQKPPHTPTSSSSTPELLSPAASPPAASLELFSHTCPSPRAEQGGVVMETTEDGVLCSQGSDPQDPPTKPPCSKKPRTCEGAEAAGSSSTSTTTTTTLDRCDQVGHRYSILVVVVHPCHLKEVQVKSGPSAGAAVPLASVVVTDQSGAEMKVVLWRRAAFWVLTVNPGDVLLISGEGGQVERRDGAAVHLFQQAAEPGPRLLLTASGLVSPASLGALRSFIVERRPLLVSVARRAQQDLRRLPYVTLTTLRVNTLVHALLRVTHSHVSSEWRNEAEAGSRSALQQQAVLTVEQPGGQRGALLLWGGAMAWQPRFSKHRDAVWDFRVLLVREGLTSDLLELHSTPWSSVGPLDPTDRRALDFQRAWRRQRGRSAPLELDVDTLLSQKYSGEVELRVQVLTFQFQEAPPSQNPPQPVLGASTPLDGIVAALSGDVTYTGCARCSVELDTDQNGIYGPCYPCLPHTAVRRFYRPGVLTVGGRGCNHLCVQVPPVPLQKILEAPPDRLQRSSAPGSQVRHIQVVAEKIQSLLSLPRKTFVITVRSHFLVDENSVPIGQDFTLLDLQVPGP
ncbi:shieldin complex subunit 2 isoform X2 [Fundulus heteroclitus]|uniref:shieldin complex subunit 2 isoform X2 n=1 Tax=Fundulus heteroclitus TaxID=8078 RepID=UPI00165C7F59|nr:shieldin complex subunit 2 isoform X2 [Fundulus heteroclitus]